MKKILSLIILGFLVIPTMAQIVPDEVVPGQYYPDTELDKYTGTWKWANGNDEFTIVLKKKKDDNGDYITDALYGGYRYVKDGKEVVNTLDETEGMEFAPIQSLVREDNEVMFLFRDKGKGNKRGFADVTITPYGNTYRMTWRLSNTGLVYVEEGETPPDPGFSVPMQGILFTKQ